MIIIFFFYDIWPILPRNRRCITLHVLSHLNGVIERQETQGNAPTMEPYGHFTKAIECIGETDPIGNFVYSDVNAFLAFL